MENSFGKHKTFSSEKVPEHVLQEVEGITIKLFDATREIGKGKSSILMMNAIIQLLCHSLFRIMKDQDMHLRKSAILSINHGLLMQYNGLLEEEQKGNDDDND